MDRGFIKLFRKIEDNPLWNKKPFSDGQAWVDLLLIANHTPGVIDKRGNRINVKRGQVGYSIKGLSGKWGWSQGKVNRFLKYLENEEQIEVQKSSLTTLITLLNFEQYAKAESKTVSRRRTGGEQAKTNKNEKNEKKVYSEFKNVLLLDEELEKLNGSIGEEKTSDLIERLGGYIEQQGKDKYSSHYATILAWNRKDGGTGKKEKQTSNGSLDKQSAADAYRKEHGF